MDGRMLPEEGPAVPLITRAIERIPKNKLDQKRTNPGPGFEKTPTPSSTAIIATKIEIPSQKRPLAKSCRFTLSPRQRRTLAAYLSAVLLPVHVSTT